MLDSALLSRAVRENLAIEIMAVSLIGFGSFLLQLFAEGPANLSQALWLDSLAPGFWRGVGLFFLGAGLFALFLCILCLRQNYRHYLIEHHGVLHSAVIQATALEEVALQTSGQAPRRLQIGQLHYCYQIGERQFKGSCLLGDRDIQLYRKLQVGDRIPVLVLAHKPRYSLLHRGRLNQQYRWEDSPRGAPRSSALA